MSLAQRLQNMLEKITSEALADRHIQRLMSGQMEREELRQFFGCFIVTHLNSIQVLAFLFSVAPKGASGLVRENLLEEMGLEEAEKAHPEMLLDLARGLGYTDRDILRLRRPDKPQSLFWPQSHFGMPSGTPPRT